MNDLLQFTKMNGVNAAVDALVSGGMAPVEAMRMLEGAGVQTDDLARPEDVTPAAVASTATASTSTPVRRAEASTQPTGVAMELGFFDQLNNAQSQEEFNKMYDALPAVQQHVYDRSFGQKITPAWAAQKADEFFKMQDDMRIQQKSPEARALDEKRLTDAQKTMQRADNMIFLMDNLRGGARGGDKKGQGVKKGEEKWRSRVGSVQGRWPAMLSDDTTLGWNADFSSLKGMINLDEAVRNAGQGSLSDGERALMAQAASLGLEQARDEPGFESAFERMYDLALETKNRAQSKLSGAKEAPGAQPAAAPANAAQSAAQPAPAAVAPGFQPGKIYRDGQGRPARFRGYDAQGNPTFDKI
ncbi:MAG: hypothetical protein ACOYMX_05795 [Burkholderiales bacterium]